MDGYTMKPTPGPHFPGPALVRLRQARTSVPHFVPIRAASLQPSSLAASDLCTQDLRDGCAAATASTRALECWDAAGGWFSGLSHSGSSPSHTSQKRPERNNKQ